MILTYFFIKYINILSEDPFLLHLLKYIVMIFSMETERLIIENFKASDKKDYFKNISHDKKVLETFMCKYAETLDDFDFSRYPETKDYFAIRLKETGEVIGIILICIDNGDNCEIGYGIGSSHWNKGYVTEATKRFIKYCFEDRNYSSVEAGYFAGNIASKRVMEKCGMTFDREVKNELVYLDKPRDVIYLKIYR